KLFAATSERCSYNEWNGELIAAYEAFKPKESRGWVPLSLDLCKDSVGMYVIVGHQAVGLGVLRDLPQRISTNEENLDPKKNQASIVSSYDERDAYKKFDSGSNIQTVLFSGESKTQIVVFRRQFERILSNTLFKI
ncbi:MAG: hypothetical protein NTV34_18080, partial [Proteobacteria bacterium]|nr:hypothetical protein [Pseudomonadota bacterium]